MHAKFNLGGYELEITSNGYLTHPDKNAGAAFSPGGVGLQIIYHAIGVTGDEPPQSVMQAFVKPSQARAIASAILSAATEAKS